MPNLTTQSSTTIDQNWAAAVQGACSTLLDFSVGSILRAIGQGTKGIALWLQGLVLQLLAAMRLNTSSGSDVDSFVADFGLTRLPAIPAAGSVTFARFTPTNQAVVPVGAVIQTIDGSQTFAVTADPSNSAWSALLNGYVIAASVPNVTVPVQAVNAGTQGNISAGTLTVLQTGISGVDSVTNASAYINGIDQESDSALKARFVLFIGSLAKGTLQAIEASIEALQQNLQVNILNNQDLNGATDNGMVSCIIDDGSGAISAGLVTLAAASVNQVRAAGVRTGVYAATTLTANVNMTITTKPGFVHATVVGQVATAVAAFINATGLANTLSYMAVGAAAFGVAGVSDVTNFTLNSGIVDLVPTAQQTIKAGTVSVS